MGRAVEAGNGTPSHYQDDHGPIGCPPCQASRASHPYEIPELLEISIVGGGRAYLNWVSASVDRSQKTDREKPAD